jgi:hypothetical protein
VLIGFLERLFHIHTILESEQNVGTKTKPKITLQKEVFCHPKKFNVLAPSFSRQDLIKAAYEAVGIQDQYSIGMEVGPLVTAYWTGARYVHFLPQLTAGGTDKNIQWRCQHRR